MVFDMALGLMWMHKLISSSHVIIWWGKANAMYDHEAWIPPYFYKLLFYKHEGYPWQMTENRDFKLCCKTPKWDSQLNANTNVDLSTQRFVCLNSWHIHSPCPNEGLWLVTIIGHSVKFIVRVQTVETMELTMDKKTALEYQRAMLTQLLQEEKQANIDAKVYYNY